LLSDIREYEYEMSRCTWFKVVDDEAQQFQSGLLDLRLHQYYARYGDYAQQLADELCVTASEQQIDNWELPSGQYQWSGIA
jgi:uncharacterized ferritin-like protein (DUF455 family)